MKSLAKYLTISAIFLLTTFGCRNNANEKMPSNKKSKYSIEEANSKINAKKDSLKKVNIWWEENVGFNFDTTYRDSEGKYFSKWHYVVKDNEIGNPVKGAEWITIQNYKEQDGEKKKLEEEIILIEKYHKNPLEEIIVGSLVNESGYEINKNDEEYSKRVKKFKEENKILEKIEAWRA